MAIGMKKMDLLHDCKKAAKAAKLSLKRVDRSAPGKGLQPLDRIRKEDGRIIPKGPCHTHIYIHIIIITIYEFISIYIYLYIYMYV